jgi:DMSO/TMAO reductase YedYZ molybdopterin-dependent catalytic subunit
MPQMSSATNTGSRSQFVPQTGAYAALTRRVGGSLTDAIRSTVGAGVGALALWSVHRVAQPVLPTATRGASAEVDDSTTGELSATVTARATRRQVLIRGGGLLATLAVVGAGTAAVGRAIKSRFSAAESRANVMLPMASEPLAPIPQGVTVGIDGVAPFITPNADFYRIDTALTVPQIPTDEYELRVTGMVDKELRFSFEELMTRNVVEYDITLTCVSNTIGGELVGNARWLGVRLDELLAEADVQSGVDQVAGQSIDGYTCGFPIEAATDGRNALASFGMNGEPLPLERGFPVRLIVPGLYGYVSATKWLTEIELTTVEKFEAYWVPRGYSDRAPIKLMSRIDSVDGLGTLTRSADGMAAIGGVAWAQTIGISNVEVQIADGPWMPTEMGDALNNDAWRQWAFRWSPTATGRTSIRCRATDGNGVIQTDERSEPLPNGPRASPDRGVHRVIRPGSLRTHQVSLHCNVNNTPKPKLPSRRTPIMVNRVRTIKLMTAFASLSLIAAACGTDTEAANTNAPAASQAPAATDAPVTTGPSNRRPIRPGM